MDKKTILLCLFISILIVGFFYQLAMPDSWTPVGDIWNNLYDSTANTLTVSTNDTVVTVDNINVDTISDNQVITSETHNNIHAGKHYFVGGYSTLASGDPLIWYFTTSDSDTLVHMTFSINAINVMHVVVYEGGTYSGGTSVTPVNSNRNSANTSISTVKYAPSSYTFGTGIDSAKVGSSGGHPLSNDIGGGMSRENELILDNNQTYMWVIVSGAADNDITFHGDWYETD